MNEDLFYYLIALVAILFLFQLCAFKFRRWLKKNWARRRHDLNLEEMKGKWQRIEKLIQSDDSGSWRLAIIEADKLLDFVLTRMQMPGQTMALRMNFASKKFFELKRVRWAHSLRNKLVHEQDVGLSQRQARAAIKEFERALRILGAL